MDSIVPLQRPETLANGPAGAGALGAGVGDAGALELLPQDEVKTTSSDSITRRRGINLNIAKRGRD